MVIAKQYLHGSSVRFALLDRGSFGAKSGGRVNSGFLPMQGFNKVWSAKCQYRTDPLQSGKRNRAATASLKPPQDG
jgi:hypothetical protein